MSLTRRRLLLATGSTGLLAACTTHKMAAPKPTVNPDDAAKLAAIDREQALLTAYDSAALAAPALAPRLAALRSDHTAHLAALGGVAPAAVAAAVPRSAPAVLARLKALEVAAAKAHATAALTASPALAAVLASLAACESSHGVLL